MGQNQRTYTTEFKRDALKYLEDHPELSVKEAALNLGIPKDTFYGWVKADRRSKVTNNSVPSSAPLTNAEKEMIRLQRENRDLKDALEVLKKAIGILNK